MPTSGFEAFSQLTRGTRAALPFLTAAAATDASANDILAQAKELGYSFRRQQGLDVIGALRNNIDLARAIRITPPDHILDPAFYGTALTNIPSNYSYTAVVNMSNGETGERIGQHITVTSMTPLTINQISATAATYATSGKYGLGFEADDISVTDALMHPMLEG